MALHGPFLLRRLNRTKEDDMEREMTGAEMVIQAMADQNIADFGLLN